MLKRLSLAASTGNPLDSVSEAAPSESTSRSMLGRNSTVGLSLMGLLASKRFAKRLTSRLGSRKDRYGSSSAGIVIEKEPTYRMEPHRKFNACSVEKIIKSVLTERMEGFKYHPKFCANMTKIISDEIKDRVKVLGFDRYKIVCMVVLSQRSEQSMMYCSRSTWDDKLDNHASYTFQNSNLYCVASVYGVYTP